jgi:hypothetical protein
MERSDPFFPERAREIDQIKAGIARVVKLATKASRYAEATRDLHAVGVHYQLDDLEGALRMARVDFMLSQSMHGQPTGMSDEDALSFIADVTGGISDTQEPPSE